MWGIEKKQKKNIQGMKKNKKTKKKIQNQKNKTSEKNYILSSRILEY